MKPIIKLTFLMKAMIKNCKFNLSLFLISMLLISFTGCTTEDYFTKSELEFVDAYEVGDFFLMASSTGDTLNFTISNKTVEKEVYKCSECFGPTKYEELKYELTITSFNTGNVYSGTIKASSMSEEAIEYRIKINDRCDLFGWIDEESILDNISINDKVYNDVLCSEYTCYRSDIGFLKFVGYCNDIETTLVLIP